MTVSLQPVSGRPTDDLQLHLQQHRPDLTGHCYRMLGSAFDAEDAVQETLVRAWRGYDRFEGRAAVRSWLHRIATNVCLDMLEGRARRARPMDLGPEGTPEGFTGDTLPEGAWVLPIPDDRVLSEASDPAELLSSRQSIRLAFVAALQRLPPRQRAVLLLREVLSWEASEVAEHLGMTVAAVNSALQRARATMASPEPPPPAPMAEAQQALLGRYVDAFERYDLDAFVLLLREDATLSMPPYRMWLRGREHIHRWMLGPGAGCRGSRLVPVVGASGAPAYGQYRPSGPGGAFEPWALQVLEIEAGEIVAQCAFLDTARLFPLFGLPETLAS